MASMLVFQDRNAGLLTWVLIIQYILSSPVFTAGLSLHLLPRQGSVISDH